MRNRFRMFRPATTILAVLMLTGLALGTSSCITEDGFGPQIDSVTVQPNTFTESETGMTDEEFELIQIATSGFEGEITDGEVFIQQEGGGERAPSQYDLVVDGDTVELTNVQYSFWLSGLDAGTYSVGATVQSEEESVTELDLASIEITAN